MRIGEPEAYTIEGVVFFVKPTWDPRRDWQEVTLRNQITLETPIEEQIAARDAIVVSSLELLQTLIVRIDNLTDEDGHPVTEWGDNLYGLLAEPLTDMLIHRIVTYGSDERQKKTEGGDQGEALSESESPPSTTTPDEQ